MRILLSVNHPADVHQFKNALWELQDRDHEILICAREKEVTLELLRRFGFPFRVVSSVGSSKIHLMREQVRRIIKFVEALREFEPDLSISPMDPSLALASRLTGTPYVCFADTEHARAAIVGALPFTDAVLTPSSFGKDIGPKQIRYPGYHELAYLHPNRFRPEHTVLDEIGLTEDDPFIIVRFVSWQASHDVGQHGIGDKVGLIKRLEEFGRVLITSEGPLPPELEEYRVSVSPEKLHDLLYYAALYVGEGATTAVEAALLGTPSIYVSSLAGTMGNLAELEKTYDLLYSFSDRDSIMTKAVEILRNPASKEDWSQKRNQLLKEKIDVTAFMVWFIQNYPESCTSMKGHPENRPWINRPPGYQ